MSLAEQLRAARGQKVPPGWLTIEQLAVAEGLSAASGHGNFTRTARDAAAAGLLEVRQFRLATATGLRLVRHYRYTAKARAPAGRGRVNRPR
jgi:hypothetical protein